jgi:hypothetical protein
LPTVEFRFIRRYPDGTEEVGDFGIGFEHVGQRIAADIPGKAWVIREIRTDLDPPTITAELDDDD